jgi:hypothetical protein
MNPYCKAALLLIRVIAFGIITLSVVYLGLDFLVEKTGKHASTELVFIKIFSGFLGLVLLFASNTIARKLTRDFDE